MFYFNRVTKRCLNLVRFDVEETYFIIIINNGIIILRVFI